MDHTTPPEIAVENPATLQVVASVPCHQVSDLERTVRDAAPAIAEWTSAAASRPQYLRVISERITARSEELARLLTAEQGKPITQARLEVAVAARAFEYYANLPLAPDVLRDTPEQEVVREYYPLGIAGLITAWNFPMALLAWKAAPALLAGNAVIVKPAPTTPLTSLKMQEIFAEVLPAGLATVLVGGNDLGSAMVAHPEIPKISFTGSTPTGRRIMETASSRLKRLTLELGGNDPAIVLSDADLPSAVEGIAAVAFRNAGQVCIAPKRLYVHESRFDDAVDLFRQYLDRQRVGDGSDESVTIGPVNNAAQHKSLLEIQGSVRDQGGTLHSYPHSMPDLPGYFVQPAVATGLAAHARLVQEEQFGPVLPLLPYRDVDDAVAAANATDYGLGASIWSSDVEAAVRVGDRVRAGTRWINQHGPAEIDVPFGGVKQSGLGTELGLEGLKAFTESRITNVKY
ncbi:aldehyde dehydrogenase family protein [Rhodococcus indonesiensis]